MSYRVSLGENKLSQKITVSKITSAFLVFPCSDLVEGGHDDWPLEVGEARTALLTG